MGLLSNFLANSHNTALSLFDDAKSFVNSFDFDEAIESLSEASKSLRNSVSNMMKDIKDTVSDFRVTAQFDENTDEFKTEVKDGILTIEITNKNGFRKTSTTLPKNCLVDKMTSHVNKKDGTIVFVIPKDIANDEKVQNIKKNTKETFDWFKAAIKEAREKKAVSEPKEEKIERNEKGQFVAKKKKPLRKKKVNKTKQSNNNA